jgi:regulatory protein
VVQRITMAVFLFGVGYRMAGKVTALKQQKGNQNRTSIYLDGRFAFGVPAIVAAALKPGQYLTDAEIDALQERGLTEAAYDRTLGYLTHRPRSRGEISGYLHKQGLSDAQIEAVCARLERAGLIDDAEFARFWVENRERFRPRGPGALRYELRSKGIGEGVIEEALESVDPSSSAYHAAGNKARQLSHLDRSTFNRKLVEYLARRGFGYDVAREAADRHWTELAAGARSELDEPEGLTRRTE